MRNIASKTFRLGKTLIATTHCVAWETTVDICNHNDHRLVKVAFFIQRSCAFLFSKKHGFSRVLNFCG